MDNLLQYYKNINLSDYYDNIKQNKSNNITHFIFNDFHKKIQIPDSTIHLIYNSNEYIFNLPKSVLYLIFVNSFNQPVGHQECKDINCPHNLPKNLLYLKFSNNFNQPVEHLPNSIKYLKFGYHFNQLVGHQGCEDTKCPRNLPNSITYLTFGQLFTEKINKFPNSLIKLTFCDTSNINNLPFIEKLTIYFQKNLEINNIPITIKHIEINNKKYIHLLKNIPFDCIITNFQNKILLKN